MTPINFWMTELIFKKLGMYIMAREPISTACFINPFCQSVYMCILLSLPGNGPEKKNVTAAMNIHATIEELMDASFYLLCRIKESRRVVPPTTICILMKYIRWRNHFAFGHYLIGNCHGSRIKYTEQVLVTSKLSFVCYPEAIWELKDEEGFPKC
jgi:hypothetical protein